MVTEIEDLLRLAWRADGDEKPGLRDALLTLIVVDGGAENAVLAERCRRLLVARRPAHWFSHAPTIGQAMANPQIRASVGRLRSTFPAVRVQRQLLRYAAERGPYTGRSVSLSRVLEDLSLSDGRRHDPGPRALPFPGVVVGADEGDGDPNGELVALYVSVLLTMAVLLKGVIESSSHDRKAA